MFSQFNRKKISAEIEGSGEESLDSIKFDLARIEENVRRAWEGMSEDDAKNKMSVLKGIFLKQIEDAENSAGLYDKIFSNRINRYNRIRIFTVLLMVLSLLAQVIYKGVDNTIGLEKLVSVFAPILIGGSIVFYVAQAFLKDYEVALEAGKLSKNIRQWTKSREAVWMTEVELFSPSVEAAVMGHYLILSNASHQIDETSYISAERAGTLSELKTIGFGV